MVNKHLEIDCRFLAKSEFLQEDKSLSHFSTFINSYEIVLDYEFIGEPNNNRIQLKLSGQIGEKCLIDYYRINPDVELPYQCPHNFELTNGRFVAVPHNKGVYLIQIGNKDRYLVKYQTREYLISYFIENLFVLVENKGVKIVDLKNYKESSILFNERKMVLINAIQIKGSCVYIIIRDIKSNRNKLFVFDKFNFSINNFSEYNLSDLIQSENLITNLRFTQESMLVKIPDFRYNSLIDSWNYIFNNKFNSLIGRIVLWSEYENNDDYYIRKEKFDFMELEIKTKPSDR